VTPKRPPRITPPKGASFFGLHRILVINGKSRRQQVKGPADDSGEVQTMWPAADFSTANVLESFGPGRYRAVWISANNEEMKNEAVSFEVAEPAKRNKAPRLRRRGDEDEEPEAPRGRFTGRIAHRREGMGMEEVLALLEVRDERAAAREAANLDRQRTELAAAQDRDRLMWQNMMQLMTVQHQQPAPGPTSPAFEELMRRELKLSLREATAELRSQFGGAFAQQAGQGDDDDTDDEDPDPEKMIARVFGQALGAVEQETPGFVHNVVMPKIAEWLQKKGVTGVKPATAEKLEAALNAINQRGHANGA